MSPWNIWQGVNQFPFLPLQVIGSSSHGIWNRLQDFKLESESEEERLREHVIRRSQPKKVTMEIATRIHVKEKRRKKRVRKKRHSDSAIFRRKQKRQLQAALKAIREYQSGVYAGQPNQNVGSMLHQHQPNSFPNRVPPTNAHLDFRDRRTSWHTESHQEPFSHRSLKNQRRRKSHLDDIYGPNFEEFQKKEYHRRRYSKWDQSDHRSSVLRSIKQSSSQKSESDSRDCHSKNDNKKQFTDEIDNNKKVGCDNDNSRVSGFSEKSTLPNANVPNETIPKKVSEDLKSTTKCVNFEDNTDQVKQFRESTNKMINIISDEKITNSTETVNIVDRKKSIEVDDENMSEEKSALTNTSNFHLRENSLEKTFSSDRKIESDEETVYHSDLIDIDKIDKTKSFLPTLKNIDEDGSCRDKRRNIDNSNNMVQMPSNNFPDINSDRLLSELTEAIQDNTDKKTVEDVTNDRALSTENELVIHSGIHNENNKPSKTTINGNKSSTESSSPVDRLKQSKNCSEHTKTKFKKQCSEQKKIIEKKKSSNGKMSSLYYPALANYTIPKLTEKPNKFSGIDEPYMKKMESLFGIDEDDENNQRKVKPVKTNIDSENKSKKRLSAINEHSDSKKRRTDGGATKFLKEPMGDKIGISKTATEEENRKNKHTSNISKTLKSTNGSKYNVHKLSRHKTNHRHESVQPSTKVYKKVIESETQDMKPSAASNSEVVNKDNTANFKNRDRKHMKIIDNKRRNSETVTSNKKLITERRHSLQLFNSDGVKRNNNGAKENSELQVILQQKNISNEISMNKSVTEKHNSYRKGVIENDTKFNIPEKKKMQIENSKDFDEISSALSKIFECETPITEKYSESTKTSDEVTITEMDIVSESVSNSNRISESEIKTSVGPITSNKISGFEINPHENSSALPSLESLTEFNSETETTISDFPQESSEKETSLQVDISDEVATKSSGVEENTSNCLESDSCKKSLFQLPQDITFEKSNSDTPMTKVTEKDQLEVNGIKNELNSLVEDDKSASKAQKSLFLVNTAIKCELSLPSENCSPLDGIFIPECHRIHSFIVLNDCSEIASIMDSPEVEKDIIVIKNCSINSEVMESEVTEKSTDNDSFDDVIEIKPNIPVIDLTKDSSDANITQIDSKEDLLELLHQVDTSGEKITIYRSDETSNDLAEVQTVSVSISPAVLGVNVQKEIKTDDESAEPISIVGTNGSNEQTVSPMEYDEITTSIDPISENIETTSTLSTQVENGGIAERLLMEKEQPATDNLHIASPTPVESNEVEFLHPKTLDQNSVRKVTPRTKSQLNNTSLDETPLHSTPQTIGQNSDHCDNIAKLTRFVFPHYLQRIPQGNRLNRAQVMQPSVPCGETVLLSQTSEEGTNVPEVVIGNISSNSNVSQVPCRAEMNRNFLFSNLTQQEYSMATVLIPYIHLMVCVRKDLTVHTNILKNNLHFLPALVKQEIKLSEYAYSSKLEVYSEQITNELKTLNLMGSMNIVTAHAMIELIFQNVSNVNKNFTKTSIILFLEHLMEPRNSFYKRFRYLQAFYDYIKFLSNEIQRRGQQIGLTLGQRKILENQIRQYQLILETERNQLRSAVNQKTTLYNSRIIQTYSSNNREAEKISLSKPAGSGSVDATELPASLRSPAHRPAGFTDSLRQIFGQPNHNQMNCAIPNSPAIVQSPAYRFEKTPQNQSSVMPNQSKINDTTHMQPIATSRLPAHRPEEMQSPTIPYTTSNISNASALTPSRFTAPLRYQGRSRGEMQKQPPTYSSNANFSNSNTPITSPARVGIPAFRSEGPQSSQLPAPMTSLLHTSSESPPSLPYSNRGQPNNSYQSSLVQTPEGLHNASMQSNSNMACYLTHAEKSPNHRSNSSPASFSPVLASMSTPVHPSDVANGRQLRFVVPNQSTIRSTITSSPARNSPIISSPSQVANQTSPYNAPIINSPSTRPEQDSSTNDTVNISHIESSPRSTNIENSPHVTPCRASMPNLINIKPPVYAPMPFSPTNYIQDKPDNSNDVNEESTQNHCEKESDTEAQVIDLTWLDEVDEEQIQKELDFIVVKKEELEDEEVIVNREQFPVEECSELVYVDRLCICEKPAEYLCKCRMVMYCSASCQARDWKDHRSICLKYSIRFKDNNQIVQ
ncbi:uncharacterized protein isoform X3 [Leptinotarsa decemlineata]|uniref:uncharacterized protein isoform X3 n=1 Tax=Leptinotarsa decemlineata TaxID=7539 RepID=UPI003D30C4C8